jgi:hypothetical protein
VLWSCGEWQWTKIHFFCIKVQNTVFAREKPHFFVKNLPSKMGCGLYTEYYVLLATEPATPVLYVVKLPVDTASVWDCYLASCCTRANAPTYYRCIGIFLLHENSRYHRFPEVGRPWHNWQIAVNASRDNQSAANAIANILPSHRQNLVRLFTNYYFQILDLKI